MTVFRAELRHLANRLDLPEPARTRVLLEVAGELDGPVGRAVVDQDDLVDPGLRPVDVLLRARAGLDDVCGEGVDRIDLLPRFDLILFAIRTGVRLESRCGRIRRWVKRRQRSSR